MKTFQTIVTILFISLISQPVYANTEADQIKQDCNNEVQSYGITDTGELQQALADCIESMTALPEEQGQENSMPAESN